MISENFSRAGKREDKAEILKALDEATQEDNWGYVPLSGPYVDDQFSQNVSVQVDKTAVLNCRILYIVGKTVSWIRSRDLHLLTVGRFTYTSDDRFKAVHQKGSDDWLLKIHYVQHRDAGKYECQVSTTPPLSHSVWLSVVEPQTIVIGGPDLYLDAGSTLNLTCVVRFSPEPPPYIFWYHEDKLLSYDSGWQGTSVATRHGNGGSISRLLIQNASPMHSGNYTCMPATSPQYSVNVHVIENEEPAAIHHKNTTSSGGSGSGAAVNNGKSGPKDGTKGSASNTSVDSKGLHVSDTLSVRATSVAGSLPSGTLPVSMPDQGNNKSLAKSSSDSVLPSFISWSTALVAHIMHAGQKKNFTTVLASTMFLSSLFFASLFPASSPVAVR
ncbi:Immunoglobulin I-set [Trinorchestia longiramus]|nr:Immunoglobulin I-set [Trinorchestia longiramus]